MGNIDECCLQPLMKLGDFGTHRDTQLGVQVGQRFVEKEYFGLTDDCAPQSDTLPLAAGQSLRFPVQQVSDIKDLRGFFHAALDLILGSLPQLQAESHIIVNRHMRIQSIVLEHHGDIAILGSNVVHQLIADIQLAVGNFFQAGDHAQGGGFSASGRADQNDKLFVFDVQREVADSGHITGIHFVDVLKRYTCHDITSLIFGIYIPAAIIIQRRNKKRKCPF